MVVPLPGARAGAVYVWLIFAAPVLLLAGAASLVVVGLALDSEGVATVGAVGVIAALILARMKGPFEIGLQGVKGTLWDDFTEEVVRRAVQAGIDEGYPPEKVAELVVESLPAGTEVDRQLTEAGVGVQEALTDARRRLASHLVDQRVGRAVRHEREVHVALSQAAQERGWHVEQNVAVRSEGVPTRIADFVVTKDAHKVVIEAASVAQGDRIFEKVVAVAPLAEAIGAELGLVAVPNGTLPIRAVDEDATVVDVAGLIRRLEQVLQ